MHESMISASKVIAAALWIWVTILLATGWTMVLAPGERPQLAMGFFSTACATSALAAVLHIRCYFVRLGQLVRANNRVAANEEGRLHSMPRQPTNR